MYVQRPKWLWSRPIVRNPLTASCCGCVCLLFFFRFPPPLFDFVHVPEATQRPTCMLQRSHCSDDFVNTSRQPRVSKGQAYKYVPVIHPLPMIPLRTDKNVPGPSVTNIAVSYSMVPSYILRLYDGYPAQIFVVFSQNPPPNSEMLTLWRIKRNWKWKVMIMREVRDTLLWGGGGGVKWHNFVEGSQASPSRPSENSSTKVNPLEIDTVHTDVKLKYCSV
jgi:hypothetical protein